jgi:hypothetical protein
MRSGVEFVRPIADQAGVIFLLAEKDEAHDSGQREPASSDHLEPGLQCDSTHSRRREDRSLDARNIAAMETGADW